LFESMTRKGIFILLLILLASCTSLESVDTDQHLEECAPMFTISYDYEHFSIGAKCWE